MYITTGVCFTSFRKYKKKSYTAKLFILSQLSSVPILSSTRDSYPVCMDPIHVRAVAKTNRRIKSSMFKDLPGPPTNPSPLISPFPKVRVTPEVPGELRNPREAEKSLREWGWCTGSHYRLWFMLNLAWLGEPAPQRLLIMGKSSCPGASGRREKRG